MSRIAFSQYLATKLNISHEKAQKYTSELIDKFLPIKRFLKDFEGSLCYPSPRLEQVWRELVLNSSLYFHVCNMKNPNGAYIHYDAEASLHDSMQVKTERYQKTLETYDYLFGPVSREEANSLDTNDHNNQLWPDEYPGTAAASDVFPVNLNDLNPRLLSTRALDVVDSGAASPILSENPFSFQAKVAPMIEAELSERELSDRELSDRELSERELSERELSPIVGKLSPLIQSPSHLQVASPELLPSLLPSTTLYGTLSLPPPALVASPTASSFPFSLGPIASPTASSFPYSFSTFDIEESLSNLKEQFLNASAILEEERSNLFNTNEFPTMPLSLKIMGAKVPYEVQVTMSTNISQIYDYINNCENVKFPKIIQLYKNSRYLRKTITVAEAELEDNDTLNIRFYDRNRRTSKQPVTARKQRKTPIKRQRANSITSINDSNSDSSNSGNDDDEDPSSPENCSNVSKNYHFNLRKTTRTK